MRAALVLIPSLTLLLVSCEGFEGKPVHLPGGPDLHSVAPDDAAMTAAVAHARATVGELLAVLEAPDADAMQPQVKVPVAAGADHEHLWIGHLTWNGETLRGTVSTVPLYATHLSVGDLLSVRPTEISDWLYVRDGCLVGGFTIRAHRDALDEAGRRALDAALPYPLPGRTLSNSDR